MTSHFTRWIFYHILSTVPKDNVNFFLNPKPQVSIFEGILRLVQDYNNIYDENGHQRFYFGWDRRVELNEQKHFVIFKEWYPWNKQQFYDWLKEIAQKACEKHWKEQKIVEALTTDESDNSTAPEETSKPDDLKAVLASLEELHKKIDALNARLDNFGGSLNQKIEDVNKEVKALYELWK